MVARIHLCYVLLYQKNKEKKNQTKSWQKGQRPWECSVRSAEQATHAVGLSPTPLPRLGHRHQHTGSQSPGQGCTRVLSWPGGGARRSQRARSKGAHLGRRSAQGCIGSPGPSGLGTFCDTVEPSLLLETPEGPGQRAASRSLGVRQYVPGLAGQRVGGAGLRAPASSSYALGSHSVSLIHPPVQSPPSAPSGAPDTDSRPAGKQPAS